MRKQPKWWEIGKRKAVKCLRCGRKIKGRRPPKKERQYCYYCGRYKGLW